MARFRTKRTHPRIAGTKKKHSHDALHLIETTRVKVNKARVRLPGTLTQEDYDALAGALRHLQIDVDGLGDALRWRRP